MRKTIKHNQWLCFWKMMQYLLNDRAISNFITNRHTHEKCISYNTGNVRFI